MIRFAIGVPQGDVFCPAVFYAHIKHIAPFNFTLQNKQKEMNAVVFGAYLDERRMHKMFTFDYNAVIIPLSEKGVESLLRSKSKNIICRIPPN